jgi:hypothetical protein
VPPTERPRDYCSLGRSKRPRRLVKPLPPGRVRAGEPFAAVLVVGMRWWRCGPWPSVSVPLPFFPFLTMVLAKPFVDLRNQRTLTPTTDGDFSAFGCFRFNDDMLNPKLHR